MKFIPGQRIVITEGEGLKGVKGIFTRYAPTLLSSDNMDMVWAVWEDTGREQAIYPSKVKLDSKFVVGDVVQVGKKIIKVDGIKKFNEQRAQLIYRKNLL